jgi:ATP-binding cassette, subfamily B, bacterial PglK
MSKKETFSIIWAFKEILPRLPQKRQNQFFLLLAGLVVAALIETFALGVLAYFASTMTDPISAVDSWWIKLASEFFGFSFLIDPKGLIIFLGAAVMVLIPIKNAARGFIMYWINRFGAMLEAFFGEKLLAGFLYTDYQWVSNRNTADLVLGVNWRVFLGREFFTPYLMALSDLVVTMFLFAALMMVDPMITSIVVIIMGTTAYLIYFKMKKWLDKVAIICRDFQIEINKEVTMAIHGIKDVKVSNTQEHFINSFNDNAIPLSRYFGLKQFLTSAPTLFLESMGFMALSGIVCFMLLVLGSSVAKVVGVMALMGVAAWRILPAMNRIVSSLTRIRSALPYIDSEIKYLDQISNALKMRDSSAIKSRNLDFNQEIKASNIDFSYINGGDLVLKGISFTICKGETIGIIGTSGAGKSTLVDLLIGLLSPNQGGIAVDSYSINGSANADWIRHIGYVPQNPYIYDGTLAGNVAFGVSSEKLDRKKVLTCCHMAAMDFLDDLQDGIDSEIGERGVRLSGGQQQRVAIARALYHEPDVLIFDEATSALDSKSEKAIQQTMYSFKGKQTLIIIAHRLSTVKDCDRLLWLDQGKLRMMDSPNVVLPIYENELSISVEDAL